MRVNSSREKREYEARLIALLLVFIAGADDAKVPPVPIPNTVVKLTYVEDTWLATTWENRAMPTQA